MKTADARLIAAALIALALSLPLSALLQTRQRSLTVPASSASAPVAVSASPGYQLLSTNEGIYRLDTQTGEASVLNTTDNRWVRVSGN